MQTKGWCPPSYVTCQTRSLKWNMDSVSMIVMESKWRTNPLHIILISLFHGINQTKPLTFIFVSISLIAMEIERDTLTVQLLLSKSMMRHLIYSIIYWTTFTVEKYQTMIWNHAPKKSLIDKYGVVNWNWRQKPVLWKVQLSIFSTLSPRTVPYWRMQ